MKLEPSAWLNEARPAHVIRHRPYEGGQWYPVYTLPTMLAALREHFSTKYVVGDEIYAEIDAFEKEQRNEA